MARRLQHMSVLDTPGIKRASRATIAADALRMTSSTHTVPGLLLAYEKPPEHPEWRAQVDVQGGVVWLEAIPGAYVLGGGVVVEITNGRPTRVLRPTDTEVPDSSTPTTVRGGATAIPFIPAAVLDQDARDAANDAIAKLGRAFHTDTVDPTPGDGEDRPNGAVWTVVNDDDEVLRRFRWDADAGAWVAEPLSVEIIPEAYIDHLLTNDLFTKNLTLSDEADGYVGRVDALGMQIFAPDDSEVVRLRADGPTMFGVAKNGVYVSQISEDGDGTFTTVGSRGDVSFDGGRSLIGEFAALGGRTYGKAQLSNAVTIDVTPKGILGVTFKLPGKGPRQLKVTVQAQASQTSSPRSVALPLYFAEGETVTTGNTVRFPYNDVTSTQNRTQHGYVYSLNTAELGVGDAAVLSVMFGAQSDSGGTWDMHSGAQTSIVVEDDGPAVPTARTVIQTADPTKPTQNTVTARQDVFTAQAFRTYDGDGSARPEVPNLYQGYTAYYPAGGRRRSAVQFPDLSGLLAGADIEWVEIDITALFWHANAGGTISVGVKDGLLPASLPDAAIGAHSLAQTHMGRGQTKTIRLPSAVHAGIKSGATRLITFFTTSTSSQFYGYFSPGSFKIRVRYQK